jgi:hypothetical protein
MTPRTVALYAFGESASGELDKLPKLWGGNGNMGQPGQILNFQRGGAPAHAPHDDHSHNKHVPPPVPGGFGGVGVAGGLKNIFVNKIKQQHPGAGSIGEPSVMPSI